MSDTPISDSTPHNVADLGMQIRRIERKLNAANDRIKRLEELVDGVHYVDGVHLEEVDGLNWFDARTKAKEAKL